MGFFQKIKEKLHMGAEKVGYGVGYAAGSVYSKVKEKYQRKYGSGEYREMRIKENIARAREQESRARIETAKTKIVKAEYGRQPGQYGRQSKQSKQGSQPAPNLDFIHGGSESYADKLNLIAGNGKKKGKGNQYDFILGK